MKSEKNIYFYIAANLSILIPAPGRFAFAIILLILFNIQMALVTLMYHALRKLNLETLRNPILSIEIIAVTILFKQLLIIICPIAAITLGFCIYLPTLASIVIEFFFDDYGETLKSHLLINMKKSLCMTVLSLFYFLIRDILGYGTLTLPAWKKIITFHIPFNPESVSAASFFATIPGSLILVAIFISIYIVVTKKFCIIANSSSENKRVEEKL